MDGEGFTIGENVNGVITLKGAIITSIYIGHKSMSSKKQHDTTYLCVYVQYFNNSVTLCFYELHYSTLAS